VASKERTDSTNASKPSKNILLRSRIQNLSSQNFPPGQYKFKQWICIGVHTPTTGDKKAVSNTVVRIKAGFPLRNWRIAFPPSQRKRDKATFKTQQERRPARDNNRN
jgi:hypothetical protein